MNHDLAIELLEKELNICKYVSGRRHSGSGLREEAKKKIPQLESAISALKEPKTIVFPSKTEIITAGHLKYDWSQEEGRDGQIIAEIQESAYNSGFENAITRIKELNGITN